MIKKKSKPKFNVPNAGFKVRVKERWRRPRGVDSKKRAKFAYAGASPRIGYKNAMEVRGMHPSGLFEILVHNAKELGEAGEKAVRIAHAVGKKKREQIKKLAAEMKVRVLN